MTRNKAQNYDYIRQEILEFCTEPKTLPEIIELLKVDKNVPYNAIQYLINNNYIKPFNCEKNNKKKYLTINFDYTPPVKKSNYKPKEVHVPSVGGRIYTLDKPFNRSEDNYHTRHIEAQRQRDAERTRARTYVGISKIYND